MSATFLVDLDDDSTGRMPHWARSRAEFARWQRWAVIGIIALGHLAVILFMATALRIQLSGHGSGARSSELQILLLSPAFAPREPLAPPLDWKFTAPDDVEVAPPEINVVPQQMAQGAGDAILTRQKLPPRLDPTHVNERPELPHTLGMIDSLSLELRILVLTDGSVGEAQVVRSTGEKEIDRIAIETVENSWRFLPASVNGKPVEAKTTVIVRFQAF